MPETCALHDHNYLYFSIKASSDASREAIKPGDDEMSKYNLLIDVLRYIYTDRCEALLVRAPEFTDECETVIFGERTRWSNDRTCYIFRNDSLSVSRKCEIYPGILVATYYLTSIGAVLVPPFRQAFTDYLKAEEQFTIANAFHAINDKESLVSLMLGVITLTLH